MSIFEYDEQLHEKTLVEYGIEQEKIQIIRNLLKENQTVEFISKVVSKPVEYICDIRDSMPSVVREESQYGKRISRRK